MADRDISVTKIKDGVPQQYTELHVEFLGLIAKELIIRGFTEDFIREFTSLPEDVISAFQKRYSKDKDKKESMDMSGDFMDGLRFALSAITFSTAMLLFMDGRSSHFVEKNTGVTEEQLLKHIKGL